MNIINNRTKWDNHVNPALPQDPWEDNTPGTKPGELRHNTYRGYSSGSYNVMKILRINTKEFYLTGSYFKPIFIVI